MEKERKFLHGFIKYTPSGKIVPGSLIITPNRPHPGIWQEVIIDLCCDDFGPNSNTKQRAFVKFDSKGKIVPGSLVMGKHLPKPGRWKEVNVNICCSTTPIENPDFNFRVYTNSISPSYNNLIIFLSAFYPITIDWGDGTIETLPVNDSFNLEHVYPTLDYYTISIKNIGAGSVTLSLSQIPVDTINNINKLFEATSSAGMYIGYCNITSDEVNNILRQFVVSNIYNSNTYIDLSNNTPPAPPTGQGILDKATLITGGAAVTTD
jgi:hypothetical protein